MKGLKQGHGQQVYVPEDGDGFSHDVYDGEWDQDNRSDRPCNQSSLVNTTANATDKRFHLAVITTYRNPLAITFTLLQSLLL